MMTRASDIADWIRQQVSAAGARGVLVALTGGFDSAVVARLCQMAVPGRVVCAILPCRSDPRDEEDAESVAARFELPVVRHDLGPACDELVRDLGAALLDLRLEAADAHTPSETSSSRLAAFNITARLRMSALYFVAESLNCLLAGAGNRSELTVGSFAKYGEAAVDLLPLGGLLEGEVRALARELEVPDAVINRVRDTGPMTRELDEEHMGFSYADLDRYLNAGPDGVSPALAMRIERLLRTSEHKRALARIPDSSSSGSIGFD
jgi:NAD+ synthase